MRRAGVLAKWIVLVAPFACAGYLTSWYAMDPHNKRVAGWSFLFANPWGWLLDPLTRFADHGPMWWRVSMPIAAILWVPAPLYAFFLWVLIRMIQPIRALNT